MQFNLNEFLMAISFTLDFVEMDILGVTSNHSKRVAYISLKMGEELGLSPEELHDIVALSILHDNGAAEKSLHDRLIGSKSSSIGTIENIKEHCLIGEENIKGYPFLTDVKNVIRYHHERYDGAGFFNKCRHDIPRMAQIIEVADTIELNFDLSKGSYHIEESVIDYVKQQEGKMFCPKIVKTFINVSQYKHFWLDLKDNYINSALKKSLPGYYVDVTIEQMRSITKVLSRIIDSKSQYTQRHSEGLSEKAALMADFYNFDYEHKIKLIIATDLHDIGKLAVPNSVLENPGKLSREDFEIIKEHPYYTRLALQEVEGFEDITEWASNHHEKLNGTGYPYGLTSQELDFSSRLVSCLDIYQALIEDRPYRGALTHMEAMNILFNMSSEGFIDGTIVKDLHRVFSGNSLISIPV